MTQANTHSLRAKLVGVAGTILVLSFFLNWFAGVSGFSIARHGGWDYLLFIIPLTGVWVAYSGFSNVNVRLASLAGVLSVIVPLLAVTLWEADIEAQLAIAGGAMLVFFGAERKAQWLALPAGLLLAAVSIYVAIKVGLAPDTGEASRFFEQAPLRIKILGVLAYGFVFLMYAIPLAALWLIGAGILKKGVPAAMVVSGLLVCGIFIYGVLLVAFGATVAIGEAGIMLTSGACISLLILALVPTKLIPTKKREKPQLSE